MHPQSHVNGTRPEADETEEYDEIIPVVRSGQSALDPMVMHQVRIRDLLRVHLVQVESVF